MTVNAPLVMGSTSANGQQIYSKGTMTINGPISSVAGFHHLIYQAGTVYVNGTNTYTGYTQILGGTVQFNADSALGNGTNIYTHYNGAFGNQIMVFAFSATNYARRITADTQWFLGVTSGNTMSFAPNAIVLNPSTVAFTKSQQGTLLFTADNQFGTGALTLNANTSGYLDFNGFNDSVASLTATVSGPQIINSSTTQSVLTINGGTGTVAAKLGGGTGVANNLGVTYAGAGVLTLAGANTFYGGLNVLSGTVQSTKGSGSNAYLGQGNVTVAAGATVDLNGSTGLAIGLLAGAGTITNSVAITNSAGTVTNKVSLTLNSTGTNTFSGVITDGTNGIMSITLSSGMQTFNGTNSYRGTTAINGGTLLVNGTTLGQSNYTVGTSGTLGGAGTIGLSAGSKVTVNGKIRPGTNGVGTLTINGPLLMSGTSASATFKVAGLAPGNYGAIQGGGQSVTFTNALNVDLTGLTGSGSLKIFDFGTYAGAFTTMNFTGLPARGSASFDKASGTLTFSIPGAGTAILFK